MKHTAIKLYSCLQVVEAMLLDGAALGYLSVLVYRVL